MSSPAAFNQAVLPIDPQIGLMFTVADHLIPLFKTVAVDVSLARQMAISAIDAYQPETRADFVNVARTLAFSMAALGLLGDAASQDMAMPEKLRAFGRANALNRSADQSERTMMQRRRCQKASLPSEQPGGGSEPPAPNTEITDAEMQAAIADIMKEYQPRHMPADTATAAPETPPAPKAAVTLRPAHVGNPIRPPAAPSPIHSIPGSGAGQPRTPPYKQVLLQQSAMQRVVEQSAAARPGP